MKLFLIGATGNIGTCIRNEAIGRGHQVTGMTRDARKLAPQDGLTIHEGDVLDRHALAKAIKGHDAVVVSHGNQPDDPKVGPNTILAADAIIDALRAANVTRVFWVGGAGSLFNAEGKRVLDTMELPGWARSAIWSMAAHLMHLETIEDLEWSFLSPAIWIGPGERTGKFRLGLDEAVFDAEGKSAISYADYAVAAVDELQNPQHIRRRFTLGY
jgi:putative NADH-flavin reductase